MSLPRLPMPTATVTLGDVEVPVRGLSFSEVAEMQALTEAGRVGEANAFVVAYSTDCPVAEAAAWLASVPVDAAAALFSKVAELSGLGQGAQFRG